MKTAIETARRRTQQTSELAAAARYARERYDLYKAKTYGPTLTSFTRLRELEQARDLAESRLGRAQAALEERTAPGVDEGMPGIDPRLD
jgi:hypothetical protein